MLNGYFGCSTMRVPRPAGPPANTPVSPKRVNSFRPLAHAGSIDSARPPPGKRFAKQVSSWSDVLSAIHLPGNFFNSNSARGAVFETPGSGFKVSANSGSATPVRFGSINPSFPNSFSVFSSHKLLTAIDSNIVDVRFFVPGTNQPGAVRGFGSVFTDVDLAGPTTIEFFDFHQQLGHANRPQYTRRNPPVVPRRLTGKGA